MSMFFDPYNSAAAQVGLQVQPPPRAPQQVGVRPRAQVQPPGQPDQHGRPGYRTVNGVNIPDPTIPPPNQGDPPNRAQMIAPAAPPPAAPSAPAGDYGVGVQGQPPMNVGAFVPAEKKQAPQQPQQAPVDYDRMLQDSMQAMGDIVNMRVPGTYNMYDRNWTPADDPRFALAAQQAQIASRMIGVQNQADIDRQRVGLQERELQQRADQADYERSMMSDPNMMAAAFARQNNLPPSMIPQYAKEFAKVFAVDPPQAQGPAEPQVMADPEQQAILSTLPADAQTAMDPNNSLASMIGTLHGLNTPGLQDPNSDIGRLLQSEIQRRFQGDDEKLADAIMPPSAEPGNWWTRNVAGTVVPLINQHWLFGGDDIESMWHQGEAKERNQAVDLINAYRRAAGQPTFGWRGTEFGPLQ